MAGLVANEKIVVPDKMLQGMGVNVVQQEVMKVDSKNKAVYTADGDEFNYDKLYLATGSSSFVPPL